MVELTAGKYEDPITHEMIPMKVSATPYYFIDPSSLTNIDTLPEDVKIFATGNFLYFENEKADESEIINVSVKKTWEDAFNQDGIRPDEVSVKLYADDVDTGKTVKLNAGNSWEATFAGLSKYNGGTKIAYTIVEDEVTGYIPSVSGDAESGYIITNKHVPETTEVKVSKTWDDASNQDGKRPTSVTVKLYADGTYTGESKILNAGNSWQAIFENLNKKSSGVDIVYTVEEEAVTGYTPSITGNAATGFSVTNTHTPETVDVPYTKKWVDSDDAAGMRPASIVVELLKNGVVIDSATLTGTGNEWSGSFDNLPKYESGVEITYQIREKVVPEDYSMSLSGNTITNTYTPGKTGVNVSKVWDDASNQDGIRPTSVTVKLYADGTYTGESKILNAGNSWEATFETLNKYNGGAEIAYTVEEEAVTGYTPSITGSAATGYTITNTHVPEVRNLSVTKIWNDNGNSDGIRPAEVTIVLYADGIITGHTLNLNAGNSWRGSFANLPKYNAGTEIVYTLGETAVSGYSAAFTGTMQDGFHVVNTHIPPTVSVPPVPPIPPTTPISDMPHSPKTGSPETAVGLTAMFSGLAAVYLMLLGRRKREE